MTSALPASDYVGVDEMDNTIARSKRDKEQQEEQKRRQRRKPVDDVDPLADFYNEQKRSSPPPPAQPATYTVDDGEEDEYSDDERKHRPMSPALASTTTPSSEKKARRSASSKRNGASFNNKPAQPVDTHASSSSSLSSLSTQQQPPSLSAANNYMSSTLPASYTGRWSADDSLALREWLRENHFDDAVWEALSEYSIADMLAVTKEDLKELLGTKQGIRLYARIQQYKQQQPARLLLPSPTVSSLRRLLFLRLSQPLRCLRHQRLLPLRHQRVQHAVVQRRTVHGAPEQVAAHRPRVLLRVREGDVGGESAPRTADGRESGPRRPPSASSTPRRSGRALVAISLPHCPLLAAMATSPAAPPTQHSSTASYYQEEHKQHSPVQPHHGSLNGATATGGRGSGGLGFMGDWLQRDDAVEELGSGAEGGYYRERSWNDKQCTIQ